MVVDVRIHFLNSYFSDSGYKIHIQHSSGKCIQNLVYVCEFTFDADEGIET